MSPNNFLRTGRIAGLVFLFCVLALIVILQSPTETPEAPWLRGRPSTSETRNQYSRCITSPDPGNIAIAVKTGATEAAEKIPMLMLTSLVCAENVIIFSDLNETVAGYRLYDALEDIPAATMEGNSDFEFYRALKEAERYGQIESMLKGARDPQRLQDLAAWTLDKYKQLHILEKLYASYPNKDWYLMMDADTYLVWPNLLQWLDQLPDPASKAYYLGSPAVMGDVQFGHGGSGILMSQATMYNFAVLNKGIASSWDKPMHDECCGDLVIGTVLMGSEILLNASWPTMNGETPMTLPFGPTHWCQPVVTMHHAGPHEMNQIANFEQSRNDTRAPLTFADLFDSFIRDVLPDSLDHWDNHCPDAEIELESYEACQSACEHDAKCFQFTYQWGYCALGYSIHLGEPRGPKEGMIWQSGWLVERIKSWVDDQGPCQAEFPWT